MCGITGFLDPNLLTAPEAIVDAMSDRLSHRGPDDQGSWIDSEVGIALGHTRLSILDLSDAGHQPMVSASRRYVISYNGELYNHVDLRQDLHEAGAAPPWRGTSDTETLLGAIEHWGVPDALPRLNGMFAFAIWDRSDRTLYLARDRLGEKPLYFGSVSGAFAFASQLSALAAHPRWSGRVDPTALSLLLRFGYIPAPWSIYEAIHKLPPGHYMRIDAKGGRTNPISYWSLADIARPAMTHASRMPTTESVDELESLLSDSVARRMQADVPVGCFLSGGVDSSAVTAMMQSHATEPVKTFTIGFHEDDFDEAIHAKAVAKHLGTDHTQLYLHADDALDIVPKLPAIWDEPFADPSQIPTYLVSRLAGSAVKVVLSGDGGDELFFGYRRYHRAQRLWRIAHKLSPSLRTRAGSALDTMYPDWMDTLILRASSGAEPRPLGQRVRKLRELLSEETRAGFYEQAVSHWSTASEALVGQDPDAHPVKDLDEAWLPGLPEAMMWIDTHSYLPDDILVKVDRASMAVSLEARVPLLDHRLVEFAWGVPTDQKTGPSNKWLLKQVLYRYVPPALVDRPKMGFGIPIESWLRGPLRDWAEDLLHEPSLRDQGFLDPSSVRKLWDDHRSGRARNHYSLWNILMFQAWLQRMNPWSGG